VAAVRPSLLVHLWPVAQLGPLVAWAVWRPRLRGARAWVLAWCALLVAVDALSLLSWGRNVHDLWITYLATPVEVTLLLWAFSLWQKREFPRLTMRLVIVPFVLISVVLLLTFENTSAVSAALKPMGSLVALGAAAFTLFARGAGARHGMLRADWFWISGGTALYFLAAGIVGTASALSAGGAAALAVGVYEVQAVVNLTAFLAMARGIACPHER
jgi:hypothetical protein